MKRAVTSEELEQRYEALPDQIAAAFESVNTSRNIFEIGRTHGLAIDVIGRVAEEVGYAMLGLLPAGEFVAELNRIVGDRMKAGEIATAINQQVFLPIREVMKQTYGPQWTDQPAAATPSAPSAPAGARQGPPAVKPAPPPPPPPPRAAGGGAAPKPPAAGTPPQVRKLEPLIIRPLPSSPQLSRERLIGTLPAAPGFAPAPKPAPIPAAPQSGMPAPQTAALPHAPKIPSAPPVTKPAAVPVLKPISPRRETAPEEPPAPIISPLGITPPPIEKVEIEKREKEERREKPPAPAAAYDHMREAVAREIAALEQADQRSKPAGPPAPSEAKAAPRATAPPPPGVTTKDELRREIEKFQAPADGGQRTAGSTPNAPPPAPPAVKPLKLPQEKIPKPQAPERYDVDPYKEPTE